MWNRNEIKQLTIKSFCRWPTQHSKKADQSFEIKSSMDTAATWKQINLNCKYFVNIIRKSNKWSAESFPVDHTINTSGRSVSKREWFFGEVIGNIFSSSSLLTRMVRRFEWSQNQLADNSTLLDTALENRSSKDTKCKYSYSSPQ